MSEKKSPQSRVKVLLLCGGNSERFKANWRQETKNRDPEDKLLVLVAGKPLIYYTLISFQEHPGVDEIYLACSKKNIESIKEIVKSYRITKVKKIRLGGRDRHSSFLKLYRHLPSTHPADIILIHNGANPLPSFEEISQHLKIAGRFGACVSGHPLVATLKESGGKGKKTHIIRTHDRSRFYTAETPQTFKYTVLEKSLRNFQKNLQIQHLSTRNITDEALLVERANFTITICQASRNNFKITSLLDLKKLRVILGETPENFLTGIGQDSHRFDFNRTGLVLAGVNFPSYPAMLANSDGDVVLHALFNAISQALGEGSLGIYADPLCLAGIKDSKKYLAPLLEKIKAHNFSLNNIGIMLECQTPKIDPLVSILKASLVQILHLPAERIGITATGGEELTAFGRGEGIQCLAIVSLIKN